MKRINEYKKLFNVEPDTDLRKLKTTYRNLVKEWHPDKFPNGDEQDEAELKSRQIIDAYHFLVSIAPETKEANLEEYTTVTAESGIADFKHKGLTLEITYMDGTTYEYFGVTKNMVTKLANADKPMRFAKKKHYEFIPVSQSEKGAEVMA